MEQKKRKRKSKQEIAWVEERKKRKHNKNEIIVSRTLISSQQDLTEQWFVQSRKIQTSACLPVELLNIRSQFKSFTSSILFRKQRHSSHKMKKKSNNSSNCWQSPNVRQKSIYQTKFKLTFIIIILLLNVPASGEKSLTILPALHIQIPRCILRMTQTHTSNNESENPMFCYVL